MTEDNNPASSDMESSESDSGFINDVSPFLSSDLQHIEHLASNPNSHCSLYRAKRYGKWVVLKCLKPQYASAPFYQALLYKEFEIGVNLSHPSVIQTLDMIQVDGLGECILLEYINGRTLKEVFQEHPSYEFAMSILRELCQTLIFIHQQQIVHRDLKPSNILVTYNGDHVKLIDFGLSDSDSYAVLKQPAGTKRYAAPEQYDANTVIDSRADIYALGLIIKELNNALPHPNAWWSQIAKKCAAFNREDRYSQVATIMLERPAFRRDLIYGGVMALLLIIAVCAYLLTRLETISVGKPQTTPKDNVETTSPTHGTAPTDTANHATSPRQQTPEYVSSQTITNATRLKLLKETEEIAMRVYNKYMDMFYAAKAEGNDNSQQIFSEFVKQAEQEVVDNLNKQVSTAATNYAGIKMELLHRKDEVTKTATEYDLYNTNGRNAQLAREIEKKAQERE